MSCLYIIPVRTVSRWWAGPLEAGLHEAFGCRTIVRDLPLDLQCAYDASRQQYNSSALLLQLLQQRPPETCRMLAVADVDLFIPVLTFVFGEAQLDGCAAVVSLHRLNNAFYGLPEDSALITERLVKEAVHELGHTFGLLHCRRPGCVMGKATYVEDIDQKSRDLCPQCREQLRSHPDSAGLSVRQH
jgi:archaemetzincin